MAQHFYIPDHFLGLKLFMLVHFVMVYRQFGLTAALMQYKKKQVKIPQL